MDTPLTNDKWKDFARHQGYDGKVGREEVELSWEEMISVAVDRSDDVSVCNSASWMWVNLDEGQGHELNAEVDFGDRKDNKVIKSTTM